MITEIVGSTGESAGRRFGEGLQSHSIRVQRRGSRRPPARKRTGIDLSLRTLCDAARPIGSIRGGDSDLLVVVLLGVDAPQIVVSPRTRFRTARMPVSIA